METRWIRLRGDATRVDPYFSWLKTTGYGRSGGTPGSRGPIRVILALADGQTPADLSAALSKLEPELRSAVTLPRAYARELTGLRATSFCTAAVSEDFFDPALFGKLNDAIGNMIARYEFAHPSSTAEAPRRHREKYHPNNKPGPVVVGIIDDGIAFAHERFRLRRGARWSTRIEHFWDQDRSPARLPWSNPADFDYGRELTRNAIEDLFAVHSSPTGRIDEDSLYRAAACSLSGTTKRLLHGPPRRATHGAHVMDIACGCDPDDTEIAEAPRIVCVQVPRSVTEDTSGYRLAAYVLDGLRYILDRADRLARACGPGVLCPVVVNLSYGNNAGPHNGSSTLERAIDELAVSRPDLTVVLPAGNGHLARCRASIAIPGPDGSEPQLTWRVQPEDRTPSFLELWGRSGEMMQSLLVQLVTPTGEESPWMEGGSAWVWEPHGMATCVAVHSPTVAGETRPGFFVGLQPTASLDATQPVAPCGNWRVRLRLNKPQPDMLYVDAWVQRDDAVIGYPRRGRQSRFEDPRYVRFEDPDGRPRERDDPGSNVLRAGTISGIATGNETVVVGGYRGSDGAVAAYSACGPTLAPHRAGPDTLALSDDSPVCHGVLAAGTRSGSVLALNGTSVAAPRITRLIARWMAEGHRPGRKEVRTEAAKQDPAPPDEARGGRGRMPTPPTRKVARLAPT